LPDRQIKNWRWIVRKRVLFLDSDKALVEALPGLLGNGIKIVATTSVDDALRRLSSGRFDTVLLGSGISQAEGASSVEVVRKMKERNPQVIIEALIVADNHKACSKLIQAGVTAVVTCTPDTPAIVRALRGILYMGTH
jgi:DNA-binding NarL/FixJ family response regulator